MTQAVSTQTMASPPVDQSGWRADFPILQRKIHDMPLIYLDSAASTQKPQRVLDAMTSFYAQHNSNVHRGIHTLSEEATTAYEAARDKVTSFINASSRQEVVFTRNTTESINLLAQSWARANLRGGDVVLLSEMEHHANLVPWQLLRQQIGIELRFIPVTDEGRLELEALDALLDERVKLLSVAHVSNVLGTINPVELLIARAHGVGARVHLDAAQSVPHMPVDVQALNVDFLSFSGHKMCGPTGIGIFWGRKALLNAMPPFLGGGDMISVVTLDEVTWADLPHKFEAGTPSIAEAIGLGAAIDYLSEIGMATIHGHEQALTAYALEACAQIDGLQLLGPSSANERAGLLTFTLDGVHPHDIAATLDERAIAIRAGHHCAQPLHARFGIPASARASFYLYNEAWEIDALVEGLEEAQRLYAF